MTKVLNKNINEMKDIMTDLEWKEFVEDVEDGRYDYLRAKGL